MTRTQSALAALGVGLIIFLSCVSGAHALDKLIGGNLYSMVGAVNQQGVQDGANAVARLPSAAATTNATSVKAAAGTVYSIDAYNTAAAVRCLKLYNKASAPTVGTDVPFRTIAMKPTDRLQISFPGGLSMSTGIAYALTTLCTDADATALTAGDVLGLNIDYQ